MRLETSYQLLERLRAMKGTSWYGLAKLLGAHLNTIYSWKAGHTIVDRKFAPRLALLLDEPAEYVLACIEAERETDPEVKKVWQRIAAKFSSHAASILLATALVFGVGNSAKAEASASYPTPGSDAAMYIMSHRRRRSWRAWSSWFPLTLAA